MSAVQRFAYVLEPVLATRRWSLDALQAELADANQAVNAQQVHVDSLNARKSAAGAHWHAVTMQQDAIGVDQFVRMHVFGSDIDARLAAARRIVETLVRARDDLAAQVVAAQRAVEALEDHRKDAFAAHVRAAQGRDFRTADDQWNSLSHRSEKDAG